MGASTTLKLKGGVAEELLSLYMSPFRYYFDCNNGGIAIAVNE
jgi:hypothetical protein